jgi:transcriptional regulator with GAF, ATPase, and Fis domain
MTTQPGQTLTSTLGRLDQLTGQLATTVAGLTPDVLDQTLMNALHQIGEALEADQTTFESVPNGQTDRAFRRTWLVPGRAEVQETAPAVLASLPSGYSQALSIAGGRQPLQAAVVERLRPIVDLLGLAVHHCRQSRELDLVRFELADALASSQTRALDCDADVNTFDDIIGESPALRAALARVHEVAPTDASVVLVGETGTGKELFARAVHSRSTRRNRPFVSVNCAALPSTLIESELFGHERGAFTGAVSTRQGRFEVAHRGTLFLDEIGDLPAEVQAKLLRVLQEGEFERVGSSQMRKVDVRVVAATNHDLELAVTEGRFRADLYYRLNVYPITLPPLRDRLEDLPRLVWFFINRRQRGLNRKFTNVPQSVFAALAQHSWPGNVRELANVIERAMIHSTGSTLVLDDAQRFSRPIPSYEATGATLETVERSHIEDALRRARWRINGPGNAAEALGLHPNTLRFRMKKLGIQRPPQVSDLRSVKRRSA